MGRFRTKKAQPGARRLSIGQAPERPTRIGKRDSAGPSAGPAARIIGPRRAREQKGLLPVRL